MNGATDKKPSLLWLAALGVVFGDIGTSPLYALQTAVSLTGASHAVGVASLVIWSVILVVCVKYALIMMRENYKGHAGVFAPFALLKESRNGAPVSFGMIAVVAFGAALMLGDGTLTPTVSVLSAVGGVVTIEPKLAQFVPGVSILILIILFAVQRFGTGSIGAVFGPVMLIWFAVIAVLGAYQIYLHPSVLEAFNPMEGISLLTSWGWKGLFIIGAVALAVTGSEALYADLSHFGRAPILRAWFLVAFPALLINYLGQAAYIEAHPGSASNAALFFLLCPNSLKGPLVLLATAATVIASQALISAVFTLCRQAKSLDLFPPLMAKHTNDRMKEQIYIPSANFVLGLVCVLLVAIFRTGDSLANAYGVAVTGAMAVTSVLWGAVMFARSTVPRWRTLIVLVLLLTLDLTLFVSCSTKFLAGGYIPLCFASVMMVLMFTWHRGWKLISESMKGGMTPAELGNALARETVPRIPGTRVYVTRQRTPESSIFSIREFQRETGTIAEGVVILMIPSNWSDPHRVIGEPTLTRHAGGLWEISVPHGYMVDADVPASLQAASEASQGGFTFNPENTFYIFPKPFLALEGGAQMPSWQRRIFAFLMRNVVLPDTLKIPPRNLIVYFDYIEV